MRNMWITAFHRMKAKTISNVASNTGLMATVMFWVYSVALVVIVYAIPQHW